MSNVLKRIGQGLVSFGSGIPQSTIDTMRADRDIAQGQAELTGMAVEQERQRPELEQRKAEAEAQQAENLRRLQSISTAAVTIQPMLENIEDIPTVLSFLDQRAKNIEETGGDSSDTRELADVIRSGRIDLARAMVTDTIETGVAQDVIDRQGKPTQASAKNVSSIPGQKNGQQGVFVVTRNPDGTLNNEFVSAGEGFQATNRQGETPADIQSREIGTAGGKTQATAEQTRLQSVINQGREVADGAPIIRRGLSLLDRVSTGGVLNEAQLAFAKKLGVETADQGELSANLGKAVLSQLRETFGAQFTENEGKRLEDLEAGFGKNNETNKRLLTQALEIIEFKARRASDLARQNGDVVTAQLIDDALSFEITGGDQEQPKRLVYNPQTGEFE